jgi:uncharacterized membrane protein
MAAKSQTGLDKNTAGALSYVLGPISGVVFLLIRKDAFVRFHAMQSTVVFGGLYLLGLVFRMTRVLSSFSDLLSLLGFVLWLVLIYKAWQGKEWEVPVLGKYARQLVKKVK